MLAGRSLHGHMLSLFLGRYLGMELLDCMLDCMVIINTCLYFLETAKRFSKVISASHLSTLLTEEEDQVSVLPSFIKLISLFHLC